MTEVEFSSLPSTLKYDHWMTAEVGLNHDQQIVRLYFNSLNRVLNKLVPENVVDVTESVSETGLVAHGEFAEYYTTVSSRDKPGLPWLSS